jgi:hypothetical protein
VEKSSVSIAVAGIPGSISGLVPKALRLGFLLAMLLGTPALGHAADRCPWMTAGSASGLLEAEAAGEFTASAGEKPAICVFTSEAKAMKRILRISVEVTPDAHARVLAASEACGREGLPLKAIGNEAVACPTGDTGAETGERVVGRVRDQVFTIEIESSNRDDALLSREALKSKILAAAEQVAGNLF